MKMNWSREGTFLIVAIVFSTLFSYPVFASLKAVGPLDATTGFPLWYQDANNVAIELCLDNNGLCLLELPNPGAPASFPDNFGDEVFYWNAEADINFPGGGSGLIVLALEGNYGGVPDQTVFGRVRIILNVPEPGTYTVTHPFGTNVYDVDAVGDGREVFDTSDIGCIGVPIGGVSSCNNPATGFNLALDSGIGPFLKWDPDVAPAAPAGYLGDPAQPHRVVGGQNNFFRVQGPSAASSAETDLFSVSGKIFSGPSVAGVSSTNLDGFYKAGDVISIAVTFNQPVAVNTDTGTPAITLETGATDGIATYASGSGTNTLAFTYTIQAADSSDDLDYVANSLALNGGTIKDTVLGTGAILNLFAPGSAGSLGSNNDIAIDITPPTFVGASPANAASVPVLDKIVFAIADNTKTDTSGTAIAATKDGVAFTDFTRDDTASDAITVLIAAPADGIYAFTVTPKDKAGNIGTPSVVTVTGNSAIPVVTGVTAANADGPYGTGKEISIVVALSRAVNVTGTPSLTLETGTTNRAANYASGSSANTLTFTYAVQAGDNSGDLDYASADALALNGGTIVNAATGDAAVLTLPTPGTDGSLGSSKIIIIDTTLPGISMPSHSAVTDSSVVITWTSAKPSSSTMKYGTSAAGATTEAKDNAMTTAHMLQLTGLAPSTGYTYTVSSCDAAGNCETSAPHIFVTEAAPAPPTTASPSPAGGGSATVTAPAATQTTAPATTTAINILSNTVPKKSATFFHSIDLERHGPNAEEHGSVAKVTVDLKNPAANPLVSIGLVQTLPVPANPDKVLSYFEFRKENFDDSDIESVVVEVKVHKHWITENSIKAVYLARYDGNWKNLRTELVSSDAEYNVYNAYADGFSYFAVVGEQTAPVKSGAGSSQDGQPAAKAQLAPQENLPATGMVLGIESSTATTVVAGLIIGIAAVAGISFAMKKKAAKTA